MLCIFYRNFLKKWVFLFLFSYLEVKSLWLDWGLWGGVRLADGAVDAQGRGQVLRSTCAWAGSRLCTWAKGKFGKRRGSPALPQTSSFWNLSLTVSRRRQTSTEILQHSVRNPGHGKHILSEETIVREWGLLIKHVRPQTLIQRHKSTWVWPWLMGGCGRGCWGSLHSILS